MRNALIIFVATLTIAGCDQSQEQDTAKHERTLRFTTGDDGVTHVEAKRSLGNGIFVAQGHYKNKQAVGLFSQKIDFGECGRVTFTLTSLDVANGFSEKFSLPNNCAIRNWDGKWRIIK